MALVTWNKNVNVRKSKDQEHRLPGHAQLWTELLRGNCERSGWTGTSSLHVYTRS